MTKKLRQVVVPSTSERQRAKNTLADPLFTPGGFFGYFKLLGRVRVPKNVSYAKRIVWRVECICGALLKVPEYYMKRKGKPRHHCGCQNKSLKTLYNREYRIYLMMHKRCYDASHVAYRHYGGRGITIDDLWSRFVVGIDKGFKAFLKHVGPAPSSRHSIDRIRVDGNYTPGNIRWATDKEQAANRRR